MTVFKDVVEAVYKPLVNNQGRIRAPFPGSSNKNVWFSSALVIKYKIGLALGFLLDFGYPNQQYLLESNRGRGHYSNVVFKPDPDQANNALVVALCIDRKKICKW